MIREAAARRNQQSCQQCEPCEGVGMRFAQGLVVCQGRDDDSRLAALPEDQRPGAVFVCIITDGLENASTEFTHAAIKRLIEQQEKVYSWTFLYMGADQDAIEVGAAMGVSPDRSLTYSRAESRSAYRAMSHAVVRARFATADGATAEEVLKEAAFKDEERDQAQGR